MFWPQNINNRNYTPHVSISLFTFFLGIACFGMEFCENYQDCRSRFHKKALQAGATSSQWNIPSRIDSDLIVDLALLSASQKKKLVILVSGVHGVEGFLGSSIQSELLSIIPKRKDISYFFIHAFNPYGMKYFRRVDEYNVDLNRNFILNEKINKNPKAQNKSIVSLLNPHVAASASFWNKISFYFSSGLLLLKAPLRELRAAILGGQYENQRGLYYGGHGPQYQTAKLMALLESFSHQYEQLLFLDIHTGYGSKGVLHLFPNSSFEGEKRKQVELIFQGLPIEDPHGKDFYSTTGDLNQYAQDFWMSRGKDAVSMALEFGTINNQKMLESIDALYRMVQENQLHWYGAVDSQSKEKIEKQFREMFYPTDLAWRLAVGDAADRIKTFIQAF